MKALVIIKRTPDTEAKIKLTADGKSVDNTDIKFIINPYDEFAIEEALKIKDQKPDTEVVIATFGSESDRELVVKALAMGADRGVLVKNENLAQADSLTAAKILAKVVESEKPDIVFCGKQAIDDDNMHVGTMLAEVLGWGHVNVVGKLALDGNKGTAEREVEGGRMEVYEFELPCVFGANKSLNTPRYASLPGIMKAKKKPIDVKTVSDLGLNGDDLAKQTKSVIRSFNYPAQKPPGKVFKGEPLETMVAKVVDLLRSEAKII
ncbi:MAG: electron transfer flavoprotein subunit beta [Oligoflexales bacterium]